MSETKDKQQKSRVRTKKTKSLEPKKPKIITRDMHDSDDPSDEEVNLHRKSKFLTSSSMHRC